MVKNGHIQGEMYVNNGKYTVHGSYGVVCHERIFLISGFIIIWDRPILGESNNTTLSVHLLGISRK